MDYSEVLSAANALSIDDRMRLVEEVWEGIQAEEPMPELTEAQKHELDRRLAEYEAHPESAVPWEQVAAEARARLRR